MFTGIIEEIGKVQAFEAMSGGKRLHIAAAGMSPSLKKGDSLAVNGVCQTVTNFNEQGFTVECLAVSLQKTTLASLKQGIPVNLERALLANGRLDGHLVQGHVNGRGKIIALQKRGDNHYLKLELPALLMRGCIPEGSLAVNGVSLTIAERGSKTVSINIIPHSWAHTTFQFNRPGDLVNIEIDIFARYIEHFFNLQEKKYV